MLRHPVRGLQFIETILAAELASVRQESREIVSAILRNDGGLRQNCSDQEMGHGLVPKVCLRCV